MNHSDHNVDDIRENRSSNSVQQEGKEMNDEDIFIEERLLPYYKISRKEQRTVSFVSNLSQMGDVSS